MLPICNSKLELYARLSPQLNLLPPYTAPFCVTKLSWCLVHKASPWLHSHSKVVSQQLGTEPSGIGTQCMQDIIPCSPQFIQGPPINHDVRMSFLLCEMYSTCSYAQELTDMRHKLNEVQQKLQASTLEGTQRDQQQRELVERLTRDLEEEQQAR